MTKNVLRAVVTAAALALAVAAPAAAHHSYLVTGDSKVASGKEVHNAQQHGEAEGHLPASSDNVDEIGHLDLFADDEQPGRIADVGEGNYAYLTTFCEPECDRGGVQIVDISDPANPKTGRLHPEPPRDVPGEGSQVIALNTKYFKGDVLIYQNEICAG